MGTSDSSWRDWFQDQLDEWRREGIIDQNTYSTLNDRYTGSFGPSSGNAGGRLIYVVGLLGSILLGLGIILYIAANWQFLSPLIRTLTLVAGTVLFYLTGYYLAFQKRTFERTGRSLLFLAHLVYGQSIWLIAQIYHLGEHYPDGYLYWFLGVLAMSVVLKLTSGALLSGLILMTWVSLEHLGFHRPVPLFMVLATFQFGLTYWIKSKYVLAPSLLAVALWCLPVFPDTPDSPAVLAQYGLIIATFAVACYWMAEVHREFSLPAGFRGVFRWSALLGFLIVLVPYSFDFGADLSIMVAPEPIGGWLLVKFFLLGSLTVASVTVIAVQTGGRVETVIDLAGSVLLLFMAWWGWFVRFGTTGFAIAVNILGYLVSLGLIVKGYRNGDRSPLVGGLLVFGLLTLVRYFDMTWKLLPRSFFFISGGIVLILVSLVFEYVRRRMIDRMEVNQ